MHVIYFVKSIGKLTLDYREGGTNHDDVPNILRSCLLLHKEQTIMTPSSLNKFFCTNIGLSKTYYTVAAKGCKHTKLQNRNRLLGLLYQWIMCLYFKILTYGIGRPSIEENIFLYCSKVKNLVARFGVSAKIGGKMPL